MAAEFVDKTEIAFEIIEDAIKMLIPKTILESPTISEKGAIYYFLRNQVIRILDSDVKKEKVVEKLEELKMHLKPFKVMEETIEDVIDEIRNDEV